MKQSKIHISSALLLSAALLSAIPALADDPVITCGEYMQESSSTRGGIVTATPIAGTSNWTLEAVPADETQWRFVQWSDGNTDNPRTVSVADLSATYEAEFHRFIYTNCISNNEYSLEETNTRGGDVDVTSNGNGSWTLEAIPADDTKWRFREWSDGNTDNPRTVTFTDLSADFTAVFTRFIYTNCYSDKEYIAVVDNPAAPNNYGYIDTNTVDGVFYVEAIPNTGYTFAQWADGSYVNPRPFQNDGSSTSTLYATFIPSRKVGKIDSWRKDGFVVTTTEEEGELDDPDQFSNITVFYNGQPVSCGHPDNSVDMDIEPRLDLGVYYLPAEYGTDHSLAGKICHVVYKDETETPVATLDTVIPYLVDSEEEILVENARAGVQVLNGGTAIFNSNQTMDALDIYPGGKAVVASNITVQSLTMRGDVFTPLNYGDPIYPFAYPELLVNGAINNENGDTIYYDYVLDFLSDSWAPFALPYPSNTEIVRHRSGEDASMDFILDLYSTAKRATGARGWEAYYDLESGTEPDLAINSGVGYEIYAAPTARHEDYTYGAVMRFPMHADLSKGISSEMQIPVAQAGTEKYEMNWNLISLPLLSALRHGTIGMYKGDTYIDKNVRYVTFPDLTWQNYEYEEVASATLYPFHPYFVQFEDDIDNLRFSAPTSLSMPKRYAKAAASTEKEINAGITLKQAGRAYDHIGLHIADKYTQEYDVNGDLAKMLGKGSRIKLYSISKAKKLAYIALPPTVGNGTLETLIPLGYDSATVGQEMTFAYDEMRYPGLREDDDIVALELVDNVTGETTDLLSSDYTCTAYQKADNNRFALNVRYKAKAPQIITGVDECTIRVTSLPDGVYDLLGRPINTQTLPAGAYIVVENGQTRKEVIR